MTSLTDYLTFAVVFAAVFAVVFSIVFVLMYNIVMVDHHDKEVKTKVVYRNRKPKVVK